MNNSDCKNTCDLEFLKEEISSLRNSIETKNQYIQVLELRITQARSRELEILFAISEHAIGGNIVNYKYLLDKLELITLSERL